MNLFRSLRLSRNRFLRSTGVPYSTKVAQTSKSFNLLDGTSIPWIAWGNGTGSAQQNAVAIECGRIALDSGIRHIDTAQIYFNEKETGEAIERSTLSRDDVYVTSKRELSKIMVWIPVILIYSVHSRLCQSFRIEGHCRLCPGIIGQAWFHPRSLLNPLSLRC